jgi:hypothetical protein
MGGFELLRTCVNKKQRPAAELRLTIIVLQSYGQKDVGQENRRYFSAPNVLASSTSH